METFYIILAPHIGTTLWVVIMVLFLYKDAIYRWFLLPRRKPDFTNRLWEYWFDERVRYSKQLNEKRRFVEYDNKLFDGTFEWIDRSEEPIYGVSRLQGINPLDAEVQKAYAKHLDIKFEEIVLGSEES